LIYLFSSSFSIGIDPLLAQHISHLFIRDTVILFEEKLHLDDTKDSDHFEVKTFY
jgi:glutamate--cysteine ligase catalytic subunit